MSPPGRAATRTSGGFTSAEATSQTGQVVATAHRTSGTIAAERYRRGVCIDCGTKRHSAGRPRCNRCHARHTGWSA
jgi:tRNA(Ile2) C34 agmatinyltransferase TiaS